MVPKKRSGAAESLQLCRSDKNPLSVRPVAPAGKKYAIFRADADGSRCVAAWSVCRSMPVFTRSTGFRGPIPAGQGCDRPARSGGTVSMKSTLLTDQRLLCVRTSSSITAAVPGILIVFLARTPWPAKSTCPLEKKVVSARLALRFYGRAPFYQLFPARRERLCGKTVGLDGAKQLSIKVCATKIRLYLAMCTDEIFKSRHPQDPL